MKGKLTMTYDRIERAEFIRKCIDEHAPHGSGINFDNQIEVVEGDSEGEYTVTLTNTYEFMDEMGGYCCQQEFWVVIFVINFDEVNNKFITSDTEVYTKGYWEDCPCKMEEHQFIDFIYEMYAPVFDEVALPVT